MVEILIIINHTLGLPLQLELTENFSRAFKKTILQKLADPSSRWKTK